MINVLSDNSAYKIITDQDNSKSAKSDDTSKSGSSVNSEKKEKTAKKTRAPRKPKYTAIEQIPCPVCGKGHIVKGKTAFGCSNYAGGCNKTYPFTDFPADSKPDALEKLIKKTLK